MLASVWKSPCSQLQFRVIAMGPNQPDTPEAQGHHSCEAKMNMNHNHLATSAEEVEHVLAMHFDPGKHSTTLHDGLSSSFELAVGRFGLPKELLTSYNSRARYLGKELCDPNIWITM